MNMEYFEDQVFDRKDFSETGLPKGEYDGCSFRQCNFSDNNLSGIIFSDCEFTGSNLSLVKTGQTTFREIKFKDCKLLGIHFENCSELLFSVDFDNCLLNLSSFYKRNLKKTKFTNCSLHEVDFTEANLALAVFENCDLAGAVFDHTNLEKADLISSFNYSIDPVTNSIKKAKFSQSGIHGLLDQFDIVIG